MIGAESSAAAGTTPTQTTARATESEETGAQLRHGIHCIHCRRTAAAGSGVHAERLRHLAPQGGQPSRRDQPAARTSTDSSASSRTSR